MIIVWVVKTTLPNKRLSIMLPPCSISNLRGERCLEKVVIWSHMWRWSKNPWEEQKLCQSKDLAKVNRQVVSEKSSTMPTPWQLPRQPSNCLVTDALTHYSTNTFKQPTKVYKLMVAQLLRLFIKVLQNLSQGKTLLSGGKLCRFDDQTYLFELFLSCGELTSLLQIVAIEPQEAWHKFFPRLEN